DHDFQLAIESVSNGSSIREAANAFHVPYTTLNSHVNNEVLYDQVGRPTKFTKEEECYLKQAALVLQSWGIPLTINEFLNLSKEYASFLNKSHLFPSGTPTYDWFYSFLKRHDNLILKKSYPVEKKRAILTEEQVDKWFELLKKVIQDNDLSNRPSMSDTISCSKVVVHRQTSKAYRIQGGTGGKAYISVMFCASAAGVLLPPFVIYKSKRLFQEWCVGGPPDTGFSNSDKILNREYLRTNYKTIEKAKFPSLLMELWNNDAIQMQTNIIKSFIKAGVFPYNPNSIDRSRIFKNKTTKNNQINNSPSSNNSRTSNAKSHVINNNPPIINTVSSPQPTASSFTSSSKAIAALNQILQQTELINSSESNDDVEDNEDEEYFPFKSTATSSIATSSMKQKNPQRYKSPAIQHHQSISSQPNKKRKNSMSKFIGFDVSDEDDNSIIDSSPADSQESLKAITSALRAVFPVPSKETSNKPPKRTVLNRNYGQIITEKHIIEQLAERKNKQSSKQSRSRSQKLNGTKRHKKEDNDRSIVSGTRSTITIQSSSSPKVTTHSSISINASSLATQHIHQPISSLSSFAKPTLDSFRSSSNYSSKSSDYLSHIYQPLYN
ncbi:unnamed protein product, partial [Rotaria sordida]